ncbi:MAG: formylglycine-generating enzyme family protein [Planctomycetes bacterium]|nr:formylglycine-generating enzyme family protein [Planctomycetota bacterium]
MPAHGEPVSGRMDVILPEMRALPGGTFLLGDERGRADERPVHEVVLDAFSIAVCPVTNAEYAVFLAWTGHPEPIGWQQPRFDGPEHPVCGVSWEDAVAYAQWLSAETRQCYHLPTEAQREYAARGGRAQQGYPWGDEALPLEGVYAEGLAGPPTGGPMPVRCAGAAGPNDFGLYHMADNVHEWCADYYAPNYYATSPRYNPRGPAATDRRVARGGSWRHHIKYSRCAARSSLAPTKRFADFGFRLASSERFEYVY